MDDAQQQDVRERVEELEKVAEKMGLYLQGFGVVGAPVDPNTDPNDRPVLVATTFMVGDVAFSDRVLNPEKYEQDKDMQTFLKSQKIDDVDMLKEDLQRRLAEGKGLFDEDTE